MCEEILVKSAHLLIQLAAYHKACTCGPEDVDVFAVVLAVVVFYCFKHASSAIGISMLVDETTCGSGILKHALAVVAVVKEFGLYGSHLGMVFHIFI